MKIALLCIVAVSAFGQKERAVYSGPGETAIPQIADGGGWKTTIYITCMELSPVPFKITFYGDDGKPLALDLIGRGRVSTISTSVAGRGTITLETAESSSAVRTGWALIESDGRLAIQAVFRQRVEGRPDFEAVGLGENTLNTKLVLPFDNVGFTTSMALAVPLDFVRATVTMAVYDESGSRIGLDQLDMQPQTHLAFTVPDRFPVTRGRRGSIEITSTGLSLSVLGLRFNGAGSFTSVPAVYSLVRP